MSRRTLMINLVVLALIGGALASMPAHAGPVTCPSGTGPCPGQAPFTKLGLYQKILQITTSANDNLQLGVNGQDIVGTSDIVLRPGSGGTVTSANGVQVKSNGSSADLYIPGNLCLEDHANNKTVTCKNSLAAGAGAALWQATNDSGFYGAYTVLQPITDNGGKTLGVHLGATGKEVTTTALTLTMSGGSPSYGATLHAENYGAGDAVDVQGDLAANLAANATVDLNGRLLIHSGSGDFEPWYGAGTIINDGLNSQRRPGDTFGLDADLANGNQVTIEPASSCTNSDNQKPRVACICFTIKYTGRINSGGYADSPIVLNPPEKHCTDLANRF